MVQKSYVYLENSKKLPQTSQKKHLEFKHLADDLDIL